MKQSNINIQAERGVELQVIQDVTLKMEELKIYTDNSTTIHSIISDLNYSIHEV